MRTTYTERLIRFGLGLAAAALLLWLLRESLPGGMPGDGLSLRTGQPVGELIAPALGTTLGNAAAALLFALPAALLLGVPAGFRPHSVIDRVLQAPAVAVMGVPAFTAAILGVWLIMSGPLDHLRLAGAAHGALTVLLAGWLARAIRDGLAGTRGEGVPLAPGRAVAAVLGRILQQTGNILLFTMVVEVVARGSGAGVWGQVTTAVLNRDFPVFHAGLWVLIALVLVGHLLGDLLVTAAGGTRPAGRLSRGWLVIGCLLFVLLLAAPLLGDASAALSADLSLRLLPPGSEGHALGTDHMGRDVLSRIGAGARTSLAIAGGAMLVAALGGAVLAGIGLATGRVGSAVLTPRVAVPGLVGPVVAGLAGALIWRPGIITLIVTLGVASIPAMGWAFRRFGMSKGQQGAALLGLVLLAFAQILLAEFILGLFGFGVMPPSASLGSLVRDAMPHLRQAPHLLWSALPGAAGVMGLFLAGHALLDAAPGEE